ncbi:MAG: IPT/TIG domain-containing protein, partial [Oscillospiraceae bacterium]
DGGATTVAGGITYEPKAAPVIPGPQITSITPNKVEEKKTTNVEIFGSGFKGNKLTLKVTVNGTPATVKSVYSGKVIVTVPALDAGTYDVVVTNSDGGATTVAGGITYEPKAAPVIPGPTISSVTPNICEENKTQEVNIYGSGFSGNKLTLKVTVNGTPATVKSVSASKVTATLPAMAAGTYDIEVTNPNGGVGTLANAVTYEQPVNNTPVPVITSVTPGTLEANKRATVTILGSNFEGNKLTLSVDVGGNPATVSSVSATKIEFTAPALAEGKYDVTVKNSTGTSAVKQNALTYEVPVVPGKPAPVITGLSDSTCEQNLTAKITINGSGFSGNKLSVKVMVDTIEALVSGVTPTTVTVTVPAMPAGTYDVTVINDDGTKATLAGGLTYSAKALTKPVVTGLSATTCPANTTSTQITIYGSEFYGNKLTSTVMVGTVEAQIKSVARNKIIITVPALVAGSYDITVTNDDGGSCTSPVQLTYV